MAKPFGGSGPPAALFHDSRDRGGTHPRGHPAGWSGILQADAYAGFNGLYATGRAPAPLTEASCWAHGGARFFELADLAKAMRAPMVIEAVRRIDEIFTAVRGPRRMRTEYKRPESLPARSDEARQAAFISRYDQLLNGLAADEVVYFADAVHPEYQSRPAHGWVRKGDKVALRGTSGRQRLNLHAALNLETFHCPLLEAERIDAASTIALLAKLEASNPGKRRIYVIADNARYHHARVVRQWLERPDCRIMLVFLPAYAPHLNAIERLWAVMHREVTHNKFPASFSHFVEAIFDFFRRRMPQEGTKWRDTVTDKFRIISHKEF